MRSALLKMSRQDIHLAALANRLPLGPVYSPHELAQDRQNLARSFLRPVSVGSGRNILLPRLPVLWNGRAIEPGTLPLAQEIQGMVNPQ